MSAIFAGIAADGEASPAARVDKFAGLRSGPGRRLIGIDFDNTLISYDRVFFSEARRLGLIADEVPASKQAVRDHIRQGRDGETAWQRLQGHVYGRGIIGALLFDGVDEFLRRCRDRGERIVIVSHKTEYGHFDPERVNLRDAALAWMTAHGFFDALGIDRGDVFFEDTRARKLARIAALGCACFIDDLDEVLSDPTFPPGVERILFAIGEGPARGYPACRSWRELTDYLFPADGSLDGFDPPLAGTTIDEIKAVRGGRNSRVHRVRAAGRLYALKAYPDDGRDRFAAETLALRLFERCEVDAAPRLVAVDRANRRILMDWIDGVPVERPGPGDIEQALLFLRRLHELASAADVPPSRLAAEACLAGTEIERQLSARLLRLRHVAAGEADLRDFLEGSLAPAIELRLARARRRRLAFDAVLPEAHRSLAPSDFGFHNALRRPDGRLAFVDFEYFGWDDPTKLVADTLLHPGTPLGAAERQCFRKGAEEIYGGDSEFGERLDIFRPLFALRWSLILLNEFLPERWQQRLAAGETASWPDVKLRQLDRARRMFERSDDD